MAKKYFKPKEIFYNIPQLGKIKAFICADYAVACYNYLNEEKFIDKLKNINQLGTVKNTIYGTHHTRWEYVVLQLYLINQFQGLGNKLKNSIDKNNFWIRGLSSKVNKFSSNHDPTGVELLQIWVLLLNSGHLQGTFASERGILKAIKYNESFFNCMEKELPSFFKPYFKDAIDNSKVNEIHNFIILFLLNKENCNKKSVKNNEFGDFELIPFLIKSLELYYTDDEKINDLKFLFNKIRQISYLFLDSQYASIPLTFNLNQFIINLEDFSKDLLTKDKVNVFDRSLDSLDLLLAHTLYYSDESIKEFGYHSKMIFERFKDKNLNLSTLKKEFSKEHTYFEPKSTGNFNNPSLHLLFEFETFFSEKIFKKFDYNFELELTKLLPKENCIVTIQHDFEGRFFVINLNFTGGNRYNHVLTTSKLMKKLILIKKELIDEFSRNNESIKSFFEQFIDEIFNKPLEELFLFIINNSINENLYIEFDKKRFNYNVIDVFKKSDINNKFSFLNSNRLQSSDLHELNMNKECLEKVIKFSSAVLSLSSIRVFSVLDKKVKRELDGCILIFKNNRIYIFLIEAKKQKAGSISDSLDALKKSVKVLSFSSSNMQFHKLSYGAFCEFILSK